MPAPDPVLLPADEYLARPLIVAWLGYPLNEGKRQRALTLIRQWARCRIGQPLNGRNDRTARERIDSGLSMLEERVNRQLLGSEIFRRQVLSLIFGGPTIFGNTSTQSFARRVEAYSDAMEGTESDKDGFRPLRFSARNAMRDLWASRRPCFALGIGTCLGLAHRPSLEELLFSNREWALRAVREGERQRQFAIAYGHPAAAELIEFRLSVGF